jgi:hypothetical protein
MYTNTAAGDKEVTLYALCSTAGDIPEAYSNVFGSCGGGASDDVICYITVGPKK